MVDKARTFDKILTVILLSAIVGAVFTIVYAVFTARGEAFTEFYLLGPGGKAGDYPTKVTTGKNVAVIVGIVSQENEPTAFRVTRGISGKEVAVDDAITLGHGEKWERQVSFSFDYPGEGQRAEFNLYKGQASTIYQKVYLRMDVE